jgi:hypothetical protein
MVALMFGMLLCVILAVAVVALVAIPARRQGREMLTPKGDEVVSKVRELTSSAVATVREKAGEGAGARDQDPDATSSRNG